MKSVEFYNDLVAVLENGSIGFYLSTSAFEMTLNVTKDNLVYLDENGLSVNIGSSEFTFYFDMMEIECREDEYGKTYILKVNENERITFIV